MASDRIQRRIDLLLDEADGAVGNSEWDLVLDRAKNVLAFDPENQEALSYLSAAERALSNASTPETESPTPVEGSSAPIAGKLDQPTSFSNGRYQVERFLGEGGRKKVYLATDTLLDRHAALDGAGAVKAGYPEGVDYPPVVTEESFHARDNTTMEALSCRTETMSGSL